MQFNDQEKQFIATSIDTLVRQTGVQNAAMALVILQKLQNEPSPIADVETIDE